MATNETTGLDLSAAATAGDAAMAMIQVVVFAIPLIVALVLLLAHLRHGHDHALIAERRTSHSVFR